MEILNFQSTDDNQTIHINGIGDNSHETFVINRLGNKDFCKTAKKPYDIVVSFLLAIFSMKIKHFAVSSDGFNRNQFRADEEWIQAIKEVNIYLDASYDADEFIQNFLSKR